MILSPIGTSKVKETTRWTKKHYPPKQNLSVAWLQRMATTKKKAKDPTGTRWKPLFARQFELLITQESPCGDAVLSLLIKALNKDLDNENGQTCGGQSESRFVPMASAFWFPIDLISITRLLLIRNTQTIV